VATARGGLLHARIAGNALVARGRIELDARILSADPAVEVSSDGAVKVAVVVAKEREDLSDALDFGIARVRLVASPEVEFRWLGVLEQIPVAAAVSFAPAADAEAVPCCVVLDAEQTLHFGDWSGSVRRAAAPASLCSPLTVTALLGEPHVAVASSEGPRLWRP